MGNVMLVVCLLLNVLFDCHYFVRAVVLIVYCKIQAKLGHVIRDAFKPATLTGRSLFHRSLLASVSLTFVSHFLDAEYVHPLKLVHDFRYLSDNGLGYVLPYEQREVSAGSGFRSL